MAHKTVQTNLGSMVLVDWTTGDPEGDRKHVMQAYKDFIKEVLQTALEKNNTNVLQVFDKWEIIIDAEVDDFPRIFIHRPEQ